MKHEAGLEKTKSGAWHIEPSSYARWRSSSLGSITERIEQAAILAAAGELSGRSVLDAGCGDGTYSMLACARGARVTAVDASGAMLEAARARALAVGARIEFVHASAECLPFEANSFDAVMMVTVLCGLQEPSRAIREVARVMRPGGCLVLGELNRYSSWAFARWLRGRLGSTFWQRTRFWAAKQLGSLIAGGGLRLVSVRGCVYYPPTAAAARIMCRAENTLSGLGTFGAAFLAVRAEKV